MGGGHPWSLVIADLEARSEPVDSGVRLARIGDAVDPAEPGRHRHGRFHADDVTLLRIVFLIFDGLQPLDLVGPHEVFSHAQVLSPDAGYVCQVAARTAGLVRAASGVAVHAEHSAADLDPAGVDTVVAVGGFGIDLARDDRVLVEWLADAGRAALRRFAAGCSCSAQPG